MGMDDLDDFGKSMEQAFGMISGMMLYGLCEVSKSVGGNWEFDKPETFEIVVTKDNAANIYAWCKEIRSGYNVGLQRGWMKRIKEARSEAHKFLVDEANDPKTSIERKIELVKLTSRSHKNDSIDI